MARPWPVWAGPFPPGSRQWPKLMPQSRFHREHGWKGTGTLPSHWVPDLTTCRMAPAAVSQPAPHTCVQVQDTPCPPALVTSARIQPSCLKDGVPAAGGELRTRPGARSWSAQGEKGASSPRCLSAEGAPAAARRLWAETHFITVAVATWTAHCKPVCPALNTCHARPHLPAHLDTGSPPPVTVGHGPEHRQVKSV